MNNIISGFLKASRPKTLPAGAAPVILATFLALKDLNGKIEFTIFFLTLACTILLQISSNLINDYYDTQTGVDTQNRLGPERVTNSGHLNPKTVKLFFILTLSISFLLGIYLMIKGGPIIIAMGIASIICAYLYTGGPLPLSHYGLGEVLAIFFYGNVAVTGSYYLQTKTISDSVIILSFLPGFLSAAIMAINNCRDIKSDEIASKLTLPLMLEKISANSSRFVPLTFVIFALISCIYHAVFIGKWYLSLPILVLGLLFKNTWIYIIKNPPNPEYNNCLAKTGKFLFLTALIYGVLIWQN